MLHDYDLNMSSETTQPRFLQLLVHMYDIGMCADAMRKYQGI